MMPSDHTSTSASEEVELVRTWVLVFLREQHFGGMRTPSVDDTVRVQLVDAEARLAEDAAGLVLSEAPLLDEIVKELTAAAQLTDDPDVRMVTLVVVVHRAREGGGHGLEDLLDGNPRGGEAVGANPHL